MNGKERLNAVINGKRPDRIPWTTIADPPSRAILPQEYRDVSYSDFYRMIGCDIMHFGQWGMSEPQKIKYPFRVTSGEEVKWSAENDGSFKKISSFSGQKLISFSKNGHPTKYPVENKRDLITLLEIELSKKVEADLDGVAEGAVYADEEISGDGIFAATLLPSPIQRLIEEECGPENFYYLLSDYRELMEQLIDTMFSHRLREYEICAEFMPYLLTIPVENTSSALISPELYRKYSLPHIKRFCSSMHKHKKKAVIHMCGHLYDLMNEFSCAEIDGIHALTPPPIGNCPYETALDKLGDDLIIIGILDPAMFHNPMSKPLDIKAFIKNILTPRIKESNFILLPGIDGIPTPIEKLQAVREAMEEYGVI